MCCLKDRGGRNVVQHVLMCLLCTLPAGSYGCTSSSQVGISCIVLEEAPGPRQSGAAIGVWSNAWRALDSLGVAQQLRDSFPALTQVEFVRGETGKRLRGFSFSECGKAAQRPGGLEFRGVRRAALLEALLQQLPQGTVRYGTSVAGIDSFGDGAGDAAVVVRLKGAGSGGVDALRCRVLVGADGARSAVAGALGLPAAKYAGAVLERAQVMPRTIKGRLARLILAQSSSLDCFTCICYAA